jgi:micrococcal nuclease
MKNRSMTGTKLAIAQPSFTRWRAILSFLLCLVCCLPLWGCESAPSPQGKLVRVSRVVSGQALEVLDPSSATPLAQPVRLLGIDAPDLKQEPWGTAAKTRLEGLLAGQTILLEPDLETQDAFGRQLAYIWHDGMLLNEQLVAEGQALAVSRSPNTRYEQRLAHAQEKARLLGLGIWNPTLPLRQTPAEFRAQQE